MSFTLGGAVSPDGLYVERAADRLAMSYLSSFQSCYILHPRQSGKSSLRRHIVPLLREKGLAVAEVDLTAAGKDSLKRLWSRFERSIVAELARLGRRARPWSLTDTDDAPERGLDAYIVEDVLPAAERGLIIFIDEINVLGAHDNAATIFAELRVLIERQARCALCMLGVSQPTDLVSESEGDPFPLMRAIALEDFSREEASSFAPLLTRFRHPQRIVSACFAQTSGHPYMLQNVLARSAESRASSSSEQEGDASDNDDSAAALVARVVEARFFNPEYRDPVLEVPHHIFGAALDQRALNALNLYRVVVAKHSVPVATGEEQQAQEMLRLAGMVRTDSNRIVARNAIFARRYDRIWVRDRLDRMIYESLAARWKSEEHHPDFLLRGEALTSARELLAARERPVSSLVADFIQASAKASGQPDPTVTRVRRLMRYTVAVLVLGLGFGAVTIVQSARAERAAERAAHDAARQTLEAELAAVNRQKQSAETLLDDYRNQLEDNRKMVASLRKTLEDSDETFERLQQQKEELQIAHDRAMKENLSKAVRIKADLDDVIRRSQALAEERSRLEGVIATARNREVALTTDIRSLLDKATRLGDEVRRTQAALNEEKERGADLARQLDSLKSKIAELNNQIDDVQRKYVEATNQLSDAKRALEAVSSKASSCEVQPVCPVCPQPQPQPHPQPQPPSRSSRRDEAGDQARPACLATSAAKSFFFSRPSPNSKRRRSGES